MRKFLFFSVALLTTTLLNTSCQKEGDTLFVDSIEQLNETFWTLNSLRTVVYAEDGSILQEDVYNKEDLHYLDGLIYRNVCISGNFFNVFNGRNYIAKPCVYDATTRIFKVGDLNYKLTEFSRSRLEMQFSWPDSQNTVYTEVYEPMHDNDKSWAEWVEYMNSENAKLQ
jgi:hypothetical protein